MMEYVITTLMLATQSLFTEERLRILQRREIMIQKLSNRLDKMLKEVRPKQ